jgi:outer membrane immunogenic protein
MRLNPNNTFKLLLAGLVLSVPMIAGAADRFQGPYAGVYLGYVDGQDDGTEYDGGVADDYTQETSPSGMAYGLLAGYNMRFGNGFVFGIEADYEGRSADDTSPQKYLGVSDSQYPVKTELKEAGSIRAKLGYVVNGGQTLVYGTAGYAAAKIERTFGDTSVPDSSSDTSWQDGWTVGAGVEHFFGSRLSLRAEYRYADYGEENVPAPVYGSTYEEHQEYDEHTFRIGVMYHF